MEFDTSQNETRVLGLRSYFDPCAAKTSLLVIRVSGNWCGTCRWHATKTVDLKALDIGNQLHFLDLLVSDIENVKWTPFYNEGRVAMQDEWRDIVNAPGDIANDPKDSFRGYHGTPVALPLYVIVDRRTMEVAAKLDNPSPETLRDTLRAALAHGDGLSVPPPETAERFDGRFNRQEWDMIQQMVSPAVAPPDPTNEYADDPAAAELGKAFFFDPELSPTRAVSCATCHDPAKALTDGLALPFGVAQGDRNAPGIALAAHSPWQFWDGAADSLWMQAAAPFKNPAELASSKNWVAHRVVDFYRGAYHAVFGAKYPLPDLTDVPANGEPIGTHAVDVTRLFVNVAKSIAAFERTMHLEEEPLDRYAAGDTSALTDAQKDGLAAFFRAGCAQCHFGPRLTDDAFHVLRWPSAGVVGERWTGRRGVTSRLPDAEFSRSSRWSDSALPKHRDYSGRDEQWSSGAFRTPSLRGVAHTAPYGHAGTVPTLADAVSGHGRDLDPDDTYVRPPIEPWVSPVDPATAARIATFLEALDGVPVVPGRR